jgi:hypothetical protein
LHITFCRDWISGKWVDSHIFWSEKLSGLRHFTLNPYTMSAFKENYSYNLFKRGSRWLRNKRATGNPLHHILLYQLTYKLISKSYNRFISLINLVLIASHYHKSRFMDFQFKNRDKLNKHFYIIVLPGTLHLINICLPLIPETVHVFLITNGTEKWENEYLKKEFNNFPQFNLLCFPGSSHNHGRVLNHLLKNNEYNFGIIDYDLFLFERDIFNRLEFLDNECVIGAFEIRNDKIGIVFPTTHFMFFNIKLLQTIMGKYGIGAQEYRGIPRRLKKKLASIGLGYQNFLKSYLLTFDTLNLILAMALYENLSIKFVDPKNSFHLGRTGSGGKKNPFILYPELKFLEMPQNAIFKKSYLPLFSPFKSSCEVLNLLPLPGRLQAILDVDAILNHPLLKKTNATIP